ncbi:hypothetical protein Tsubulata_050230 [Turnera subulata]|uniref:Uncharacterized protein n=1 Tax=Turnera subulata TaxID=218843 RepID=A0A9Q0G6B6_9ROSI|nr:hypothetical protein Tsubulata_050230 [Turnera subulata]
MTALTLPLPWQNPVVTIQINVLDSQNAGLLESVLLPFDIYNDSAQQALSVVRQRFLWTIVLIYLFLSFVNYFHIVQKLGCKVLLLPLPELLDPSFLFALDNGEKYSVQPMRLTSLFKMTRVKELENLLSILKHTHKLLSKDLSVDSFNVMMNEMQENISLVSFSSRFASQVWLEFFLSFLYSVIPIPSLA